MNMSRTVFSHSGNKEANKPEVGTLRVIQGQQEDECCLPPTAVHFHEHAEWQMKTKNISKLPTMEFWKQFG